jgi:hypothetical protein
MRTKGAMSLELVEADLESADAEKMTPSRYRPAASIEETSACATRHDESKRQSRWSQWNLPYLLIGFAKRTFFGNQRPPNEESFMVL